MQQNGRLKKSAAITVNSLNSRTIILARKNLEAVPIIIGAREVVEQLIVDCVNERNHVQQGHEADYLSDKKYEAFLKVFESKVFQWWNNGNHGGETTWNLTFHDDNTGDQIMIDVILTGVEVYELLPNN